MARHQIFWRVLILRRQDEKIPLIHSVGQSVSAIFPKQRSFSGAAHCYSTLPDTFETYFVRFQGAERRRPGMVGVLDAKGPLSRSTALCRKEGSRESQDSKDRRAWVQHGPLVPGFARMAGQNVRITPF